MCLKQIGCLLACLTLCLLCACGSSDQQYDVELDTVFNIPLPSTVEDIISFEASTYNHFEYDLQTDENRNTTAIRFAPYFYDGNTCYKHIYRFDPKTKELTGIEYGNIPDSSCHNKSNICPHVEVILDAILDISQKWEHDNSKQIVYGTIDGHKCHITYFGDNVGLLCLSVEE